MGMADYLHIPFMEGALFETLSERILTAPLDTVETTSFATPTLDSPPLISMYYLPYKNEEVKKFVLY